MLIVIVVFVVVMVWCVIYIGSGDPKPPEEDD